MANEPKPTNVPDYFPDDVPEFMIGQLVCHRRYGYRGVVVDYDLHCRADEQWYQSNQTQPDRDQPWYHVLVDATPSVTYAAQSSLTRDNTADPIDHPLVERFFDSLDNGIYQRNDEPWPGTQ